MSKLIKKSAISSSKKQPLPLPEKKKKEVINTSARRLKKKKSSGVDRDKQTPKETNTQTIGNQRSQVVSTTKGNDRSKVVLTTGKKKQKTEQVKVEPPALSWCDSVRCVDTSEAFMALELNYCEAYPTFQVLDKAHCLMFSSVMTEEKVIQCLHNVQNKYGNSSGTLRDTTNYLLNVERNYPSPKRTRLELKEYLETNHQLLKVTGKLQSYIESLPKAAPVKKTITKKSKPVEAPAQRVITKKPKPVSVPKEQVVETKKRKIVKRK